MKPLTLNFRNKAAETIGDKQVQQSLEHVYTGFFKGRLEAAGDTPEISADIVRTLCPGRFR